MSTPAYTARALADLLEIGAYIALDSPRRAEAFLSRLEQKASAAARTPRIYKERNDLSRGLRSAPVGKYLILYRIVENGIEVVRIVHGARDLKRLLDG